MPKRRLAITEPMYHGGAPGLTVGQRLMAARYTGMSFSYFDKKAQYDPDMVYLTTDPDVARAYAGRYLDHSGQEVPGDLYRAEPIGQIFDDPDYMENDEFPGVFLMCRQAVVAEVIDRNIDLTIEEQLKLEIRYLVWGDPDLPIYDENGHIIPSPQMSGNGVTREWTTMLRPWLRTTDIDAAGKLGIAGRAEDTWMTILNAIPSMDTEHQIKRGLRSLRCRRCRSRFAEASTAAKHQLGDRQVDLLTQIHAWTEPPVPPLVDAARRRDPHRWEWLT